MTTYHASNYDVAHRKIVTAKKVPTGDITLEGDLVVWEVDETLSSEKTITLIKQDSSRASEYRLNKKPLLVIKNSSKADVNNVVVKYDGSTLYTFAADNSSTSAYAVFKLTDAGAWQLA